MSQAIPSESLDVGSLQCCRKPAAYRLMVRKMLQYAVPPGYQRQRPKLGPWLGVIDAISSDDKQRPAKQRHTSKQIFERLKGEHGFTDGYLIVKNYMRTAMLCGYPGCS